MTQQSQSDVYREPLRFGVDGLPPEEVEITKLINARLQREDCLESSYRETSAYRIAEIMVAAKKMFTVTLPRLTNVNGESTAPMDEDLSGLRMTFLHLCDLMHDFDSTFLQAMGHRPEDLPGVAQEDQELLENEDGETEED